jgi:N-acetylmuramoyl-L-alanine amidase
MIEMRLALIVGHSVEHPGAMGVYPIDRYEYYWNLDLANVAYRYAKDHGLNCRVFLRNQKSIEQTYKEVNEWCKGNNAVAIELHFNSVNGQARGTETLFDDDPSESLEFARHIHQAICALYNRTGKQNRGLKKRVDGDRGAINLKAMKAVGCLIEPFFGDNKDDAMMAYGKMFELAKTIASVSFNYMIEKEATDPKADLV